MPVCYRFMCLPLDEIVLIMLWFLVPKGFFPFITMMLDMSIDISEIIDPKEIQDARGFTRNEILLMLDGSHPEDLWVPGKQAIARSLIQSFADGEVA